MKAFGKSGERLAVLRLCIVAVLGLPLSKPASAEDWPFWRGANRNDVPGEDSRWDQQGWPPKDASWNVKVGEGASAPVVAGGTLFTLGWADGTDTVMCLDASSGKHLWEQSYSCPQYGRRSEGDKGLYSGPSASPAYDRETGLLYTLSTDGDLNCWDTKQNGQRV